jgi:hypothetical protein
LCWVSKWLRKDSAARLVPQTLQSMRQRFVVDVLSPVCWLAYSSSVWATCIFPGKHVMTFVFLAFVQRPIRSKRVIRMSKLDCSHSGHLAATNPSSTKNAIHRSRTKFPTPSQATFSPSTCWSHSLTTQLTHTLNMRLERGPPCVTPR